MIGVKWKGAGNVKNATDTAAEQLHQFAESLGNAVDARDTDTFNHSWEVAELARMIAEAMGLSPMQVETVHLAAHLHDIGKIGIPDVILKKQGRLSEEEWDLMRRHPEIGALIIRPVEAFASAGGVADMVLFHHERFDGKGYPQGVAGDEIPLGARIIAVADTLSAMLQNRPYRAGTTLAAALTEVERCSGSQFDPAVVTALMIIASKVGRFLECRKGDVAHPVQNRFAAAKAMNPIALAGLAAVTGTGSAAPLSHGAA